VRITTYQPDTQSNPNSNRSPNPSTKQHTIVNIKTKYRVFHKNNRTKLGAP